MARCDDATLPYRARTEFWWWLEQRLDQLGELGPERAPDQDPPQPLCYLQGVAYRHHKRAERMALRSLGEWEPPESRFPKPWTGRQS